VAQPSAVVSGRGSATDHAKRIGHRNEPINKVYEIGTIGTAPATVADLMASMWLSELKKDP
jgi:hypothetical protein